MAYPIAAILIAIAIALPAFAVGRPAADGPVPLPQWRSEAGRIRTLAENDAPRAYEAGQRLQASLPADASPADRARALNLLARIETYMALTELTGEAKEMTDKTAREKAGTRMEQLIKRYESEGRQREIDELTRRSEQQAAQLRQRELQQRWLWTLLVSVVVALAGAALFAMRLRQSQRQLKALNEQLQRSENDIRTLYAGLEQRVQAATQESRQQARYLRTLIDMLPMWAWFKDTHSRYLVVNQAHAEARGYTVDAMVGQSDQQLLPPEQARKQVSDDAEVMASRERKTTEERVGSDGAGAWMETYKAAVLDDDGTVLGTVGVARNISERKAAEAAREAALSEARQLARQRSEFLAQMSHELRTPLNGILGFAQILQRDKALTEQQARGLRIIDESGQHLLTLINDILDLARIDAAKLELYPTEVYLPGLLQVVCDIVRVKAEEKSLLFVFQGAPDLPSTVVVDEKRLRQVLLNLLSNAVKFTDTGHVTLRATLARPLAAAGAKARLRFEVQDEGVGISEAQLARLFQPFEQAADAKRREGGTGLGLAISRQLVRLMGGDVQVRSRPGGGSVFSFEFEVPTPKARAQAQPECGTPVGYAGERRKVLVVDDVPQNRAMLLDAMASLGFEVADAANGIEALEVAARFEPDLVVMDLMMPVMDGFEATRRLRATPQGAQLPIIATSASATAETDARSRAAGANAFIGKPIEQPVLISTVGTLLGLTWTREEAAAPPAPGDDDTLVPPPPDEVAVLRQLARTGDMGSICEWADRVKALDSRYEAFAARLRALAEGCQTKAIAGLIERYGAG